MSITRRSFLKILGGMAASIPVASSILNNPFFAADASAADLPLAKPGEGMAKNLHYCDNADKPSKFCAERKDKTKAGQNCKGCLFFNTVKGTGKAEVGTCQVMPQNFVHATGWCMSWQKKA